MPGCPSRPFTAYTRWSTTLSKTSSPTAMSRDRIAEPAAGARPGSGDAREPEERFVELGLRRQGFGGVPPSGERCLVCLFGHRVADPLALLVAAGVHLPADQPLEHRLGGFALAAPTHGLLDAL